MLAGWSGLAGSPFRFYLVIQSRLTRAGSRGTIKSEGVRIAAAAAHTETWSVVYTQCI